MAKLKLDTIKTELYNILDTTNKITKDYLIKNILTDVDIKKSAKKEEVVALVKKKVNRKKSLAKQILEDNAVSVSIHPSQLEEDLGCTKTERKRWEEEGKFRVATWGSFRKYGRSFDVPYYNLLDVLAITREDIAKWRAEHDAKTSKNRKAGAKKAVETRNKNKELIKEFKKDYEDTVKSWRRFSPKLASTLELAYWTQWCSRIAKSFQIRAKNATTYSLKYTNLKDEFYTLKEKAVKLLVKDTEHVELSVYIPENPHKMYVEHLCETHYQDWVNDRECCWDYYGYGEYIADNYNRIFNCKHCLKDIQKHYYTLYYINIKNNNEDTMFSFHVPHPIGEDYLPDIKDLEQVEHQEQEGMFRFGRGLENDEEIIYTEKRIREEFKKAMGNFKAQFNISDDDSSNDNESVDSGTV